MSERPLNLALIAAAALAGTAIGIGYVAAGVPLYFALAILVALAVAAAAAGIVVGAPAAAMVTGVVAALAAWDLMRVDLRLRQVKRVEHTDEIERRELRWTAAAAAVGLALAALGLALKAEVSFTLVFALAVIAALALGRAIRLMRS